MIEADYPECKNCKSLVDFEIYEEFSMCEECINQMILDSEVNQ